METFFDNMVTDMMRREDLGDSAREPGRSETKYESWSHASTRNAATLERHRADLIE